MHVECDSPHSYGLVQDLAPLLEGREGESADTTKTSCGAECGAEFAENPNTSVEAEHAEIPDTADGADCAENPNTSDGADCAENPNAENPNSSDGADCAENPNTDGALESAKGAAPCKMPSCLTLEDCLNQAHKKLDCLKQDHKKLSVALCVYVFSCVGWHVGGARCAGG